MLGKLLASQPIRSIASNITKHVSPVGFAKSLKKEGQHITTAMMERAKIQRWGFKAGREAAEHGGMKMVQPGGHGNTGLGSIFGLDMFAAASRQFRKGNMGEGANYMKEWFHGGNVLFNESGRRFSYMPGARDASRRTARIGAMAGAGAIGMAGIGGTMYWTNRAVQTGVGAYNWVSS